VQTVSSWQNYNNVQIDYTLSNTYTLRMNNMDREAKMLILQQAITKRDSQDGEPAIIMIKQQLSTRKH
jgi:hypothetical protein